MKADNQPPTVTQNQIELEIKGMTCESCAAHVVQALTEVEGVDEAHIQGWRSGRASASLGGPTDVCTIKHR